MALYGMTGKRDDVRFVRATTYRRVLLKRLVTGPATPTQLVTETDYSLSYVSLGLGELREQGLIELLVSEDRKKGRVYGSTERGVAVWETIDAEHPRPGGPD